jgi:hypothetical protein
MREKIRQSCTHDAYIFKVEGVRKGRKFGEWVPEGYARIEPDGELYVYLHSTPVGGFDGRIRCTEYGSGPPQHRAAKAEPKRPGDVDEEEETEIDGEG